MHTKTWPIYCQVPTVQEAAWAPMSVWTSAENLDLHRDSNLRPFSPHQVSIPTTLSWLATFTYILSETKSIKTNYAKHLVPVRNKETCTHTKLLTTHI
jgi:3-methyladenine DNA glycosylase AlkC